jgi:hypothetical protein
MSTTRAVLITVASLAMLGASGVAESPDDIQPLRTGDSIPAVTVTTVAGDDFDLAAVVAEQPTVLIFYRGGW